MHKTEDGAPWRATAGSVERVGTLRMRIGACLVEPDLDRIVAPHGETALEPKTMAVLAYLARHPGKVVSASELIDAVWLGRPMGDNPVYRCIAQLRRALGDNPKAPTCIATVPTKGYRLIAPVEVLELEPPPRRVNAAPAPAPTASRAPDIPLHRVHAWRPGIVAQVVVLIALAGLAVLLWVRRPAVPVVPERPTLAVLPLRAAASGEAGMALAQSVTDLVRDRLGRLHGLAVVAGTSTARIDPDADARSIGTRLHARYLLRGTVAQAGGRLRVDLQLLDASAGTVLSSLALGRPVTEMAALRDEVVQRVVGTLHMPAFPAAASGTAPHAIRLDAYTVYLHGQQRLSRADPLAADEAVELFRRATILDPRFARAYLGLGQALARQIDNDSAHATLAAQASASAFDRALELDPTLGEAWVGKAALANDPANADALYRKGLALAVNDSAGFAEYAGFLFGAGRVGEAIQAIEHARDIDPLEPRLYLTQAFFIMVVRSDVAEHDRLVRQALELDPSCTPALYQLAYSRWEYSGEFAEAAQLIQRAIALEPQALGARLLARDIYLDLGDAAAAAAVLGPAAPPVARVEIAQYRGDRAGAAALLKGVPPAAWPDAGPQASKAQAVRDAAMATGDWSAATDLLQATQAIHVTRLPMAHRGYALVYAHALVLAGKVAQGRALAQSTLALVDAHGIGRADHWFSRERAAAFAVLGDDAQVLQELAYSVEHGQVYRWWYLAERDPLYAHLRGDPRFQALDRQARAHRDRQRALLAAGLRRSGRQT